MTKEELKQEAEEYWIDQPPFTEIRDRVVQAYLDGAEPREKQLTKAKEIIRALLKHTHSQNLNTQNDFDLYLGRIKEAEQFLKETN